jgi:prepilin-type processing-associated H-X9-DG protein
MIELLMTVSIIGVIVSLLLPGLLSGRSAARRVSCVNNLRQIGLALQNYQTQLGVLPPGVVNPTGPVHNRPDDLHIGWVAQLLPYVEQRALAEAINTEVPVYAPENITAGSASITSLLCPSEPAATKSPRSATTQGFRGAISLNGMTSYAACHHDVEAPIDADNHGVFFLNSAIRDSDITDGCSTTIFVGEKRVDVAATDLGYLSGTRATLRNTGHPINAPNAAANPDDDTVGGFASAHPGGANFAFGDGSVRFLRETIQPRVLRLLGHRADGEMIGGDEF